MNYLTMIHHVLTILPSRVESQLLKRWHLGVGGLWWMTVITADGCADYLVKRIPTELQPSAVSVKHKHTKNKTVP